MGRILRLAYMSILGMLLALTMCALFALAVTPIWNYLVAPEIGVQTLSYWAVLGIMSTLTVVRQSTRTVLTIG